MFLLKIPGPYVDTKISTSRGNCSNMKKVTGIVASSTIGIIIFNLPSNIIIRAAQKVTVMVAIEKKSVERPIINLLGKDLRKSSSAYRDVRIPKNINTDVDEEKREIASATIKTVKDFSSLKIG
jgi:phosphoribosylformylglycinamidine (FGAM) synthase PurS component